MKTVLLAGNTAWSMYNFRGGLIRSLIGSGYCVTVVAPEDGIFEEKIRLLGADFCDIKIEAKGTNPIVDAKLFWQFKKIFKTKKPDFVFFYTIKPNIYGSFAARSENIPHIAITTGLGYIFLNNSLISKVARQLYKLAFKSAKEVWFLNQDDLESFLQYKLIPQQKSCILKGEGVDIERFKPTGNQQIDVSFLLMARMLWDKGIGEYVEAARRLKVKYPKVSFKLLGFMGVNNPSAISREQMDEWESEGIIEYLGSTNEVFPFIQGASCIVLPSYREGVPITLLEAASMCKPIVATNSIGCRETVSDGITGYLCKVKDAISLAEAMEKIIKMSPEQRHEMGKLGRSKMEKEFDEKLIIAHYMAVLQKYSEEKL